MSEDISHKQLRRLFDKGDDFLVLSAKITKEGTELFADCSLKPGGDGHIVTAAQLMSFFEAKVDTETIDSDAIEEMVNTLNSGNDVDSCLVATGVSPVDGEDGRIEFLVKKFDAAADVRMSDEDDLRSLHLFDNVEAGMSVARLYPGRNGKEGVDVLGRPIKPRKGQDARVKLDKSLSIEKKEVDDDFDTITANISGYLTEENGKLCINNELLVSGDVDFKTGNIDFVGRVRVVGNVMKNFVVKGAEGVYVKGDVQEGFLDSSKGSVEVYGSVIGGTDSTVAVEAKPKRGAEAAPAKRLPNICACNNAKVLRAQGAAIEAGCEIEVVNESMNSTLIARGAIISPTGRLFGGTLKSSVGVEAAIIGSQGGSKTRIELQKLHESSTEYRELVDSIQNHGDVVKMLRMQLGPFAEAPEKVAALEGNKRAKLTLLIDKLKQVEDSMSALVSRRDEILAETAKEVKLRVNFRQKLYRGTEVRAARKIHAVKDDIDGPRTIEYVSKLSKFKVTRLAPLERKAHRMEEEEEVFLE